MGEITPDTLFEFQISNLEPSFLGSNGTLSGGINSHITGSLFQLEIDQEVKRVHF